ncbi:cytochrome-c peroxidase [Sphingomonas mali]|uniref:cytochrome-c peroxidase n=1 Tax=Sphingomonas mali TaxID=40682 RepID=UPI000A51742D|nr:cytochrome-c peroxidase [Sphingomonas mali]
MMRLHVGRSSFLMATSLGLLVAAACNRSPDKAEASNEAATSAEPALKPSSDPLLIQARELFKPIPINAPELPGNPASAAKVALGKMLYFDPRLSVTHSISCASCHNLGLGGADNSPTSAGFHGERGGRNSPTVFNAVFNFAQFWDGRAKDLEEQAGGPLVNPVEMASPKQHVAEQLAALPRYHDAFALAFPGDPNPVSLANAQKAIAVFEATLITPNAPFDRYLRGDITALDASQKAGLSLFMDKGCTACHAGVNLGGSMYAKFGLVAAPDVKYRPVADKGRSAITGNAADEYFFKVPTLRNIALTAPYYHTGSEQDLAKVVDVMAKVQLGQNLTKIETDQLVAFLNALTGDQPRIEAPQLPASDAKSPPPDK